MAYTILWCCGFNRALPFSSVDQSGTPTRDTTYYRTGTSSIKFHSGSAGMAEWVRHRIPGSPTNPSIAVAVYAGEWFSLGGYGYPMIRLRKLGLSFIDVRWNATTHTMDLYVDDILVAEGTIEIAVNDWFQVQIECTVAVSGSVKVWLDGHLSIDYTGNTTAASSPGVDYCYLRGGRYFLGTDYNCYFDDWVIATGDRVGDARIDELIPNGDASVTWTRSAGSANYETVDETPHNDADYNFVDADAMADELDLTEWIDVDPILGVTKQPIGAMSWVRSRVDVATGQSIRVGVNSNGTIDQTLLPIFYAANWYDHMMQVDPSDNADWNKTKLDALKLRYESEM